MHSSTTTPSVLVDKTRLMPSNPIDRIGSELTWDNLCLDPISIYSGLSTFKVNLLAKTTYKLYLIQFLNYLESHLR